jgi:hypothetical protein
MISKSKPKKAIKRVTKKVTKKSLPKMLEKTQRVFNAYIRNRDEGLPCISCGSDKGNQAGHYFTVKGFSAIRFDEWNVNLQCAGCNLFLHGNQAMYRIGLVEKIGAKAVAELEQIAVTNRIKKWSISELQEIIDRYK